MDNLRSRRFSEDVVACLMCVAAALAAMSPSAANETVSGVGAVFDDEILADNVLVVCNHASGLSDEERFAFLSRWVLPKDGKSPLRLQLAFSPTNPGSSVNSPSVSSRRRMNSGGQIVSPALELVDVAAEVNSLDVLRAHVEQITAADLLTSKNRLAMLAIILLKQKKLDDALEKIDLFAQLSAQEQPDDRLNRVAEVLLFHRSLASAVANEVLLPAIDRVVARHNAKSADATWIRQFRSLQSLRGTAAAPDDSTETESIQWVSSSTVSAETRGAGIPPSQWKRKKGQASNTVSHGEDHLYFAIPMRGNFQIECDATAFDWSETRLLVCGTRVSPVYDHVNYDLGDVRNSQQRRPIVPRLTKITEKLHLRTVVQNRVATTSVNGRSIHSQQLTEDHDPWVAIHNGAMQTGSAFNVRVTGSPEVPDAILITASPMLDGWLPYFGGPVGWSDSQWQNLYRSLDADNSSGSAVAEARGGGIRGVRLVPDTALPPGLKVSSHHEEALFYHRPILENGTIEYEFFYRDGEVNAHPVIDRLCLLMDPDGMKIHWLTDGKYERTELAPDNETTESENPRGRKVLPLIANAWNRANLRLRGDVITVSLNGQHVYERILEPTNQRLFGFFHFADREELRVRNVRWTGDWPRTLPSVQQQELALIEADFLDENIGHMASMFEHNFMQDGLVSGKISIIHGIPDNNLLSMPEGLQAVISGEGGYHNATIAPSLQVSGDFDIVAAYDQFESSPSAKGSSSLMLIAFLENSTADELFVTRRHMFYAEGNEQQILQCAIVQKAGESTKRDYFVTKTLEDRGGRLRLARRGSKFYYLSAEGDSPNFRLWATRECSADPIQMDGIRLVTQIHESGRTSVVWTKIVVKAEKLSGTAVGEIDPRVAKLNEQRDSLAAHVEFDFTKQAPDAQALYRWTDLRPWNENHQGLRILAPGEESWQSAGVATIQPILGDFDIRAELKTITMARPQTGEGTAIFLQIEFADPLQTQTSAIYSLNDAGAFEMGSQIRSKKADGAFDYRKSGTISAASISAFRCARRGTTLTVLGQSADSQNERIISQFEVTDAPVTQVKLLLHTGGPDRQSEMLVQSLEIHAASYARPMVAE